MASASRLVGRSFSSDINSTPRSGIPFAGAFPACFRVARSQPGPLRPREVPPLSLRLNYRNYCAIISRALISSPQGGYMVHAARAATPSAPAPLPTRHFLIGHAPIKNARNSPEYNALYFSNRLKTANCSARFSRVLRPKNHDSPVARHRSRFTTHQSLPTNHAFLIASRQILKIALTTSQQTRKDFLIASFSGSLPLAPRPALVTHHCLTSLLFRTNKPHRIIILMRALMKTKEKQFSIRYKFAPPEISGGRGRLVQLDLPFVRQRFEDKYGGKCANYKEASEGVNRSSGKIRYSESQRAQHDGERVHHQHSAAMPQPEIRKPVRGVVLAGRSEGQQPAPRPRNGDERGVKNRYAENQHRNKPCVREQRLVRTNFQPERGHQKTEEHRAAVTHKNFRRIEIPAQKSERGAERGRGESRDHGLPVGIRRNGEEARGHRGDAGAQAVHVIENAKRGRDADDPQNGEAPIESQSANSENELRKKLRANAGSDQENGGERHGGEKFYLVMQQPAVVKEADNGDQRGAGQDADDLLHRRVMPRQQHSEDEAQINGDAAEERNGIQMNFARPGFIHHAEAQRQIANRRGEPQRREQRDGEGDQFRVVEHFFRALFSCFVFTPHFHALGSHDAAMRRAHVMRSCAASSTMATNRSSSLTLAYLAAVSRARRPISASRAGWARSSRIAAATATGSSGSAATPQPDSTTMRAASHSAGAITMIGRPAARIEYNLLGTTTPSSPRFTVTMCRSPAIMTCAICATGRKGANFTFAKTRAEDSSAARFAPSPMNTNPLFSLLKIFAAASKVSQAP